MDGGSEAEDFKRRKSKKKGNREKAGKGHLERYMMASIILLVLYSTFLNEQLLSCYLLTIYKTKNNGTESAALLY